MLEMIKSIDADTYEEIAMLLAELDIMGDYVYTVEDVAEIVGVSVEVVEYVDRAENAE